MKRLRRQRINTSLPNPDPNRNITPLHASTLVKKVYGITKQKKIKHSLLRINCQSVKKKKGRVGNMIGIHIMTETWLDSVVTDSQYFPANNKLERKDRTGGKGGGVLVAFKLTYLSKDVTELQTDSGVVLVKIQLFGCKTLCIY